MDLKNKAVWITGASTGIGKALALEFAKNGEIVLASARRKTLIDSYKKETKDFSENIIPIQLDITDFEAVQTFYKKYSKDYFINTLINNAGKTSFNSAEKDSLKEVKDIIDSNLTGSITTIKTVLPEMIEKNTGSIINILSVVTKKIFINSSTYSASKAGLLAYSNSLREEVRKNNIRIINVIPGATKTPIWPGSSLEKYSHRMMSPEDLAKLVYQIYNIKTNMVTEEIVIRPIQGDI